MNESYWSPRVYYEMQNKPEVARLDYISSDKTHPRYASTYSRQTSKY